MHLQTGGITVQQPHGRSRLIRGSSAPAGAGQTPPRSSPSWCACCGSCSAPSPWPCMSGRRSRHGRQPVQHLPCQPGTTITSGSVMRLHGGEIIAAACMVWHSSSHCSSQPMHNHTWQGWPQVREWWHGCPQLRLTLPCSSTSASCSLFESSRFHSIVTFDMGSAPRAALIAVGYE